MTGLNCLIMALGNSVGATRIVMGLCSACCVMGGCSYCGTASRRRRLCILACAWSLVANETGTVRRAFNSCDTAGKL